MSSVNDSPNHSMVLDAISRGMKPVGKLAKVTRMDKALVVIAEKKGFFGGKKGRNND
jgi:hypothetical protein